MPRIIIQDTDVTLRKFYDVVSEARYKVFTDEMILKVDEIFQIIANSEEVTPSFKTNNQLQATLLSGQTIVVNGNLSSTDSAKWSINSVAFTDLDGTLVALKGNFKLSNDTNGFAAGTTINQIDIQNATGLSTFFGIDNVITNIQSKNSITYNGNRNFSGIETRFDRTFNDGWSCQIRYRKNFNYSDGNISNTGSGLFVDLTDPSGIKVLSFDVSDYELGATDPEAYDEAYRAQFFSQADYITGTAGNDNIDSYASNDTVVSGAGNDTVESGEGNDSVNAGEGSDLIVGGDGAGNDNYDGGKGIDLVKYSSAKDGIRVDLAKGTASSLTTGDAAGIGTDKLKNIENIIAGDYSDSIIGCKNINNIVAGSGNDTIDGGLGNDTLVGGDGTDTFVFSTKPSKTNVDTISDFQPGLDKIQLNGNIFTKLKAANDYLAFGTASDSKNDYLIYDSATGKLSYDSDGSSTKIKPVDIAVIGQGLKLTIQDIEII